MRRILSKIAPPHTCFCGAEMVPAGYGKYPYDCPAAEKWPGAMIYIGCKAGHQCWDFDAADGRI